MCVCVHVGKHLRFCSQICRRLSDSSFHKQGMQGSMLVSALFA